MLGERFFSVVSVIGSLPVYVMVFFLFLFFDGSWFFLPFGIMLVLSTLVSYLIKWLLPRARPAKERRLLPPKRTFWNHWRFVNQSSFPSAHTTLAAGLFVLTLFFSSFWASVFSFVFLVLVAGSRVFLREHYWRDVVAGFLFGCLFGLIAWWSSPFLVLWF